MLTIPPDSLHPQTLQLLLESFIAREGTDYGEIELSLSRKVDRLRRQLDSGAVLITFDEETESCNLMTRTDYEHRHAGRQVL
jgi:uncharacterized protein YheU (UPF0270 family)